MNFEMLFLRWQVEYANILRKPSFICSCLFRKIKLAKAIRWILNHLLYTFNQYFCKVSTSDWFLSGWTVLVCFVFLRFCLNLINSQDFFPKCIRTLLLFILCSTVFYICKILCWGCESLLSVKLNCKRKRINCHTSFKCQYIKIFYNKTKVICIFSLG